MTILAFAVEPKRKRFKRTREEAFLKCLEDVSVNTVMEPVTSVRSLLLDHTGRTGDGFRMTTWAFHQLCSAVCPGLYQFVMELSGQMRTSPKHPRSDFCFDEALGILNQIITRRFFSRLEGRQMIRNIRTNIIDGVVGPKYRWLQNLELYQRAKEILREEYGDVEFYQSVLNGRWMLLRFYNRNELFALSTPTGGADKFFSGYHFSNSEVGQASIKAGVMILRSIGRTAAISPLTLGSRLRHAGRDFDRKLAAMLTDVTQKLYDRGYYQQRLEELREKLLGLGSLDIDEEEHRRDDLAQALIRRRMHPLTARRVVSDTMCYDSYVDQKLPIDMISPEVMQRRNIFDLYNAIGRRAKKLAINSREQAEQLAYTLLTGKLRLPA